MTEKATIGKKRVEMEILTSDVNGEKMWVVYWYDEDSLIGSAAYSNPAEAYDHYFQQFNKMRLEFLRSECEALVADINANISRVYLVGKEST